MITEIEKGFFEDLFNRGGYVLNFSDETFNNFTFNSIGVRVKDKYELSKGKSLRAYVNEASQKDVLKLYTDMLDYYEAYYSDEIDGTSKVYGLKQYQSFYKKCKEIIERENKRPIPFSAASEKLKETFDSDYINKQIDLMVKSCEDNPTEAIGKAKELLESCCKTILEAENQEINKDDNVSKLVSKTLKVIKVPNLDAIKDKDEDKFVKQITGGLNSVTSGITNLRNHYGSGHGKSKTFKSLTKRHAELAVGSSITLVRYIWDSYSEQRD